jgi:hypothetical protein
MEKQKTMIDFYHTSRVSWYELEQIPPLASEIFFSEEGSRYYTVFDADQTAIIRVSNHWGMVNDCFWLIAGEAQGGGQDRIGCAHLSDFEDRSQSQWKTCKDLKKLLPEGEIEIVPVFKKEVELMINRHSYKAKQASSAYGFCNARIGWTLYSGDKHAYLPPNMTITGENQDSLKIKGTRIPYATNRNTMMFAYVLSKLIQENHPVGSVDSLDRMFESINQERPFFKGNWLLAILEHWRVLFTREGEYFVFHIQDETIKVLVVENLKGGLLSSFVKEIEFS